MTVGCSTFKATKSGECSGREGLRVNIICNVDININIGTEMATSKPGREEEKLRRWGKESFKGEWGEDDSNCVSLSLSSLIFVGSHKGVT